MHVRLLIVGAGGFGREVLMWARDLARVDNEVEIGGFVDDNADALREFDCPEQVLGSPSEISIGPDDSFVCAVGDPRTRRRICECLQSRGAKFSTLIHPTAIIGPNSRIGTGCILCPYSVVTADAVLGDFVILNIHTTIGHDAKLGNYCTLSGHCDVTGHAGLGEGVFLGSHASVLPGIKVGDYARVGAGSAVMRRVKPETTVVGVPAKVLSFTVNEPSGSVGT